jgi:hypothetical protein
MLDGVRAFFIGIHSKLCYSNTHETIETGIIIRPVNVLNKA